MSFKTFFKEREKKINLLHNLKTTIIDDTHSNHKILEKNGVESKQEIIKIYLAQGHQAYHSGDLYTYEYFIKSLFDIYQILDNLVTIQILNEIKNFGLMSAHNHDNNSYKIILENYKEHLLMNAKIETFRQHLDILRNFALTSLYNNYLEGVLGVVHIYKDLFQHFDDYDMPICQIYLKNAIINLIYSAEKFEKDDLKGQILPEINDVLGHEGKNAASIENIKESLSPIIQDDNINQEM